MEAQCARFEASTVLMLTILVFWNADFVTSISTYFYVSKEDSAFIFKGW
jgi:hypothetical protein